jgi:hypothetical protein
MEKAGLLRPFTHHSFEQTCTQGQVAETIFIAVIFM